jgi:hypothetical protein
MSMYEMLSTRYPATFVPCGILRNDDDGLPLVSPNEATCVHDRSMVLVFRDGPMLSHYFHFVEILFGAYCLCSEFFSNYKVVKIYVGAQEWSNPRQNFVQQKLLEAIYPNVPVCGSSEALVNNALIIDRAAFRGAIKSHINKFLDPFLQIGIMWSSSFRERVRLAVDAVPTANHIRIRAAHVTRSPPRILAVPLSQRLEHFLSCLRTFLSQLFRMIVILIKHKHRPA